MTNSRPIVLSIIVVNWNSAELLRKCLKSVEVNVKAVEYEVIVIDNASFDGSETMVEKEFPFVHFIQSQENLGFARANNMAFASARGEVLLFLNPDTEVVGSALDDLIACLESLQDAGVIGPKLLNSDLSIQTSCVRSYPTLLNRLLDSDYLRGKIPKSSLWGNRVLFEVPSKPEPVEAISGACLLIRRSTFEAVGQFSSLYFMYAEDTDLCYRVQSTGLKNYYIGWATVVHHGGQSSSAQPVSQFSSLMMKESTAKFFQTHRGAVYARLFRFSLGTIALLRLIVLGMSMILPLHAQRRRSLRIAFDKWVGVLRWVVGLETWVKKFQEGKSAVGRTKEGPTIGMVKI